MTIMMEEERVCIPFKEKIKTSKKKYEKTSSNTKLAFTYRYNAKTVDVYDIVITIK